MGRNNADFQHSVMYHGSSHSFQPGDTILPGAQVSNRPKLGWNWDSPGSQVAYASSNPMVAEGYAMTGKTRGKVYRVEPLDKDEVEAEIHRKGSVEKNEPDVYYYSSKKGFKVLGEHDG